MDNLVVISKTQLDGDTRRTYTNEQYMPSIPPSIVVANLMNRNTRQYLIHPGLNNLAYILNTYGRRFMSRFESMKKAQDANIHMARCKRRSSAPFLSSAQRPLHRKTGTARANVTSMSIMKYATILMNLRFRCRKVCRTVLVGS